MTNSAVVADEITVQAEGVPAAVINSSVNDTEGVQRDSGLILTKDQIKSIKKYEAVGLALPITEGAVFTYLGYKTGAGPGLEAVDFLKTFTTINQHARTWDPLRSDLMVVGSKLEVFAGQIQVYGKGIDEAFAEIKAVNKAQSLGVRTLEDLRNHKGPLGPEFKSLELDGEDKEAVKDLAAHLDEIFKLIRERQNETESLKERLRIFHFELATVVAPAIKQQIAAIDNNRLGDQIQALQLDIDARAVEIDRKTEEYKKAVNKAVQSALGFNPVGVLMAIYTGVEAEKIRKARNRLREEQSKAVEDMKTKSRILGRLGEVRQDLQELDMIVIDADIATQNLNQVWNSLSTFIESSVRTVDSITDGLNLFLLSTKIKAVIRPWEGIEKTAGALLNVFKQADIEYLAEAKANQ